MSSRVRCAARQPQERASSPEDACRFFTPLEDSSPARLVEDVYPLHRLRVTDEAGNPFPDIGVYRVERSSAPGRSVPPLVQQKTD